MRHRHCRERVLRWLHTDLSGYPTMRAEEETEETLSAEPKQEQLKKGRPHDRPS
jgi:hypothetical protein